MDGMLPRRPDRFFVEEMVVKRLMASVVGAALAMVMGTAAYAGDASEAVGEPALDMPTMHSLGVWWAVKGDDNANAVIDFSYRKAGGGGMAECAAVVSGGEGCA